MATYKEIQEEVKRLSAYKPRTCWIADVSSDHGNTQRQAPNPINPNSRKHPCPPKKRPEIEKVLRLFGMVWPLLGEKEASVLKVLT